MTLKAKSNLLCQLVLLRRKRWTEKGSLLDTLRSVFFLQYINKRREQLMDPLGKRIKDLPENSMMSKFRDRRALWFTETERRLDIRLRCKAMKAMKTTISTANKPFSYNRLWLDKSSTCWWSCLSCRALFSYGQPYTRSLLIYSHRRLFIHICIESRVYVILPLTGVRGTQS